jgi:hypothetical protein
MRTTQQLSATVPNMADVVKKVRTGDTPPRAKSSETACAHSWRVIELLKTSCTTTQVRPATP